MALIKCTKCGQMISDKAFKCPKCGCPVELNERDTPKISEDVESNTIVTNDSKASTMVPSSPKSTKAFWKNKNHLIFLVLSILILALIAIVIYLSVTPTNKLGVVELETEENVETRNQGKQDQLVTNKIEYNKQSSKANVSITIDYPSDGPSNLVENLRNYIIDVLSNDFWWEEKPQYDDNKKDGQTLVNYVGQFKMKALIREHEATEEPESSICYDEGIDIVKIHDADKYITYGVTMCGGHGGVSWYEHTGKSFRKADGKKIDIIKNLHDQAFKKLLVSNVVEQQGGMEFCEGFLSDDFFTNPIPKTEPYMFNGKICFIYQKYEIAQGAAGCIMITIDKKNILPYLTDEAKELLEDEVKIRSCSLNGTISQYKIHMDVTINGNEVRGTYSYDSQPKDKKMTLKGTIDNNNTMYLSEYDPSGDETGYFNGIFDGSTYEGVFSNYSRNSNLNFHLEIQ